MSIKQILMNNGKVIQIEMVSNGTAPAQILNFAWRNRTAAGNWVGGINPEYNTATPLDWYKQSAAIKIQTYSEFSMTLKTKSSQIDIGDWERIEPEPPVYGAYTQFNVMTGFDRNSDIWELYIDSASYTPTIVWSLDPV